jgi:8-oxo-dGTP pyrophosphatase MutT (NUDIX family)
MESTLPTIQIFADEFLESCGTVTFDISFKKVCLIHNPLKSEYLLPKGRRNCNESRVSAACREFGEETGYGCNILPISMATRAPPAPEWSDEGVDRFEGYTSETAEVRPDLYDPFAVTVRDEGDGKRKFIWWYAATVGKKLPPHLYNPTAVDLQWEALWMNFEEAIEKLTFQGDRELVRRAIKLTWAPQT